jgi:hypothetical protein
MEAVAVKQAHTPGPWVVEVGNHDARSITVRGANDLPIAEMWHTAAKSAAEDAALIAAAPDLLAACVAVAGVFQDANDNDLPLYALKCRDAIAKAQP